MPDATPFQAIRDVKRRIRRYAAARAALVVPTSDWRKVVPAELQAEVQSVHADREKHPVEERATASMRELNDALRGLSFDEAQLIDLMKDPLSSETRTARRNVDLTSVIVGLAACFGEGSINALGVAVPIGPGIGAVGAMLILYHAASFTLYRAGDLVALDRRRGATLAYADRIREELEAVANEIDLAVQVPGVDVTAAREWTFAGLFGVGEYRRQVAGVGRRRFWEFWMPYVFAVAAFAALAWRFLPQQVQDFLAVVTAGLDRLASGWVTLGEAVIAASNPREMAIGTWLLIAVAYSVAVHSTRPLVFGMLRLASGWRLMVPTIGVCLWTGVVVRLLAGFGLWDSDLLKDTVVWTLFSGVAIAFSGVQRSKGASWRTAIAEQFSAALLVEYIVNAHSFSLWAELLMVPVLFLFGAVHAYARSRKEEGVSRILGAIVGLAGLGLLVEGAMATARTLGPDTYFVVARDLALPMVLAVAVMPLAVGYSLISTLEQAFLRVGFSKCPPELAAYSKRRIAVAMMRRPLAVQAVLDASGPELVAISTREDVDRLLSRAVGMGAAPPKDPSSQAKQGDENSERE